MEPKRAVLVRLDPIDPAERTNGIAVSRAAYDSVASQPDAFAKLRSRLETGPFIDAANRSYFGNASETKNGA